MLEKANQYQCITNYSNCIPLHQKLTSFVPPATHELIHDVVIVQHVVAIRILRASRPVDHHVAEHLESRVDLF